MNILVTGGCGFIGSHVVDALITRGDHVTVLDDLSSGSLDNLNARATHILGDVADPQRVNTLAKEADAIVHLAAIASVQVCENEPERAARTNVVGTENIFSAAATHSVPIVYASSAAVYGDNKNLPLSETSTTAPLGNYGRHKLENEATAQRYASKCPSVGLRFFNVYGERQHAGSPYSGVISKFMANARAGETLTFFGDGEQTRDFMYVGDVARLVLTALSLTKGTHIFNGCTGQATSLKQLARSVGIAIGKPIGTRHESPRVGDIRHSLGNPTLAAQQLRFTATTALAEGLKRLVSDA